MRSGSQLSRSLNLCMLIIDNLRYPTTQNMHLKMTMAMQCDAIPSSCFPQLVWNFLKTGAAYNKLQSACLLYKVQRANYISSSLSCFVPIFPMFVFYLEMEERLSVTLYIGVFWRRLSVPKSWTRNKVLLQLSVSSAIMRNWNVKSWPTNGERENCRRKLEQTQMNTIHDVQVKCSNGETLNWYSNIS